MPHDLSNWHYILARHGAPLLLFARQWTRCLADAEDAVQDGFVRYWRSDGRATKSIGYLYSAVRSAAIDITRSGQSRRQRERFVSSGESADFFTDDHIELASAVQSALEKLPYEQREVIVMKIWADLTFAEIAEALSITLNTAAARYRYALQKLEPELAEEVTRD